MHQTDASPTNESAEPTNRLADPRVLQILISEQSSLTAARGQGQAEMSSRASMFVAALSGALVGIAFVAQASRFGPETMAFALMLLPIVLFLGITTFIRTVDLSAEDVRWAAALHRVRTGFVAITPEVESYVSTVRSDDRAGTLATISPIRETASALYGIATTPGVIAVVTAVLAGATAGVVATLLTLALAPTLLVAAMAFAATLAILATYGSRVFGRALGR